MQRTEAERQFYLSMAGIRMWYARDGLPGAAPSPEFLFPEEDEDDPAPLAVAPEPAPKRSAPPRSGPPPAWSGLKAMVSGERTQEADKPTEATVKDPVVQPESESQATAPVSVSASPALPVPLKLDLGIWAGRQVLLISSVTDEASARLQDTLATNILRALGDDLQSRAEFHWPVFANGEAVNDQGSFADCLGRLGKQYSGLRTVLLGIDEQQGLEAVREAFSAAGPEFPHGLAGLATSPERKRELWELLKPLAARS
jgi:hypothetical protein